MLKIAHCNAKHMLMARTSPSRCFSFWSDQSERLSRVKSMSHLTIMLFFFFLKTDFYLLCFDQLTSLRL